MRSKKFTVEIINPEEYKKYTGKTKKEGSSADHYISDIRKLKQKDAVKLPPITEKELERINISQQRHNKSEEIKKAEKDAKVKAALLQKKRPFTGVGAGIHNDQLYFGSTIDINNKEQTVIITSDREIYVDFGENNNQIREEFGLKYRFDFFGELLSTDWSNESINEFLYGTPKDIGLKKCYELIYNKQSEYMWHPKEGYHETISCDILSTYFIPIYSTKGRTFINADKAHGKTQQSNIYAGLSFHPLFSGNISGASVYRVIESLKPTLIVDDFDKIPEEQKISFDQTLRVGYKKGMKAIRTDDKRPLGFDLYSAMVINNIFGLDEVSESRCSKHILEKAPDNFSPKDVENEIIKWQKERDLLYTNALLHWREVEEVYNKIEVPEFKGRERERDIATLTIAKIVGVFEKVKAYLLDNNKVRIESDVQNDTIYHLLVWWKQKLQTADELTIKYSAKEIAHGIADNCISTDSSSPYYQKEERKLAWHIGKFLSRHSHAVKTTVSGGTTRYLLDYEGLTRVAWSKNYSTILGLENKVAELNTPSPPNQPNQPNILNTPKIEEKQAKVELVYNTSGGHGVLGGDKKGTFDKNSRTSEVVE